MRKLPVTLNRGETWLGWIYWAVQLLVLPTVIDAVLPLLGLDLSVIQFNFIFFALNFLFLTVIFHRFLGEHTKLALKQPFRVLRYAFGGYVFFWISTTVIGIVTAHFVSSFSNVNDVAIMQMAASDYTLTAIDTVLLAPVAEELMYRGLLFGSLHHRSPAGAFILSTIVFAAIHVVGYIGLYRPLILVLCFLQYIPAGLCLGWAYTRSGNIWAPILAHIAINQTSILTMR